MTQDHRARLSRVMGMAWAFWRDARQQGQVRSFGDCLRGAWRMSKRLVEAAVALIGGRKHLRLSKSLIRSPIARSLGANSLGDYRAAYLTARLGR